MAQAKACRHRPEPMYPFGVCQGNVVGLPPPVVVQSNRKKWED